MLVRILILASALLGLLLPAVARAEGVLYVARDAPTDRRFFPLKRTEVKTDVAGDIVSTTVTQTFQNPYPERIEAVYVFPLPNRAAVDDMEMRIGSRVVRADVKRRAEAQAAYDEATRKGQRAALLEQERPNVFTFSVANVDPGGEIKVRLHFFELAKYESGTYEIAFPMVVGPRYVPGTPLPGQQSGTGTKRDTDRVPDASRISPAYVPPAVRSGHTVALSVHLDAGAPIDLVDSPTHETAIAKPRPNVADVSLRDKEEIPNRDFVLRWRVSTGELRASSFTYRAENDPEGYVALLVEPKHDVAETSLAPREIFFLLDTSGSMQGAPIAAVKRAIVRALDGLHPNDTFQIIDFADSASSFAPRPLPNTPANVAMGKRYLEGLQASGGTNQLVGIASALRAPGDPERQRSVVFMTDGFIGNEAAVLAMVEREIGRARIHSFGVGSSVNRFLLDEVAHVGRGASEYLRLNEDAGPVIERFYARISRPYLTDVTLDWGGAGVDEIVPAPMRDLSAFEPLVVLARYRGQGTANVTLKGKLGARAYEQKLSVVLPDRAPQNPSIARLWAREKIAQLTRVEHRGNGSRESEIVKLATAHHLVTQYTSLVAIDQTSGGDANRFPMLVSQPAETPEGVNVHGAGGAFVDPNRGTLGRVEPLTSSVRESSDSLARIQTLPGMAPPASEKRGGCAGCAVVERDDDLPLGAGAIGIVLVIAAVRRRRREVT
jgi:Ca-activated chloride channel family protein